VAGSYSSAKFQSGLFLLLKYLYFHVLFFPQKEQAIIAKKTANYEEVVKQLGIKITLWSVRFE
jgi:hypothetical protein